MHRSHPSCGTEPDERNEPLTTQANDTHSVKPQPRKAKVAVCPRCYDACDDGQLCDRCAAADEAFAAYHQADEMEAAGLDPWAECGEDS